MNVQITRNNLDFIITELSKQDKPSEKSKAYLQFIKDGYLCIKILNEMVTDLQNTIAVNFKSDLESKIEDRQAFTRIRTLSDQLAKAQEEIEQLKTTNHNLLNGL
jgi:seryl-tRNA synthetase